LKTSGEMGQAGFDVYANGRRLLPVLWEEPLTKVLYEKDGRIARITLNRPEVMNAIDDEMPRELSAAVERANADADVHVIVLSGAGRAFCAGYDLAYYAQAAGGAGHEATQKMPWDPMKDFSFMWRNTEHFMSLWHSHKPVVAKVHGFAVAGGSDIALCCDMVVMAEDAEIGYMPARVWGCPTTAMWVYRVGAERAKRMLFTGDLVDGREAAAMGLVLESVPAAELDDRVDELAARIASVPANQLAMQKLVTNQAVEAMGLAATQRLATIFDGVARHTPEGVAFKARAEEVGFKEAVAERDAGDLPCRRTGSCCGGCATRGRPTRGISSPRAASSPAGQRRSPSSDAASRRHRSTTTRSDGWTAPPPGAVRRPSSARR
jgi:enoyl-CoA hydratase